MNRFRHLAGAGLIAGALVTLALPAYSQQVDANHIGRMWGTVAIGQAMTWDPPLIFVAQAQESSAAQFVRSLGDEVIDILKNTNVEERKHKFHEIFTRAFDVSAMAQFAAGNYWRRADDRQKQEYIKLFGDYVATLYATKFADYTGQSFKVSNERSQGDAVAVEGTIVQGQKPPVRVDFRLRKADASFKIVDVYVEGMSLLITKRDEFMTVLSREGMDGLLNRLRTTSQG